MRRFLIRTYACCLTIGLFLTPQLGITAEKAKTPLKQGRELTSEFCQACHYFEGTNQAGTLGPPFVAMKPRFPERAKLEKIIYDPHRATKPDSMMPPFGRNGLLDEHQIQLIINYLYTL